MTRIQILTGKLSRLPMKRSQKVLCNHSVTMDLETCGPVWFSGYRYAVLLEDCGTQGVSTSFLLTWGVFKVT